MINESLSARTESIGAGAPGNEIEITPAMIAAGVSALLDFDSRFERESDAVVDIFCAMMTAKEDRAAAPADGTLKIQIQQSESRKPNSRRSTT